MKSMSVGSRKRIFGTRRSTRKAGGGSGVPATRPVVQGMRIGVSRAQGLVYMVPAARSRRKPNRSRKNLAALLLDEAMDPAVERNADKVTRKVDDLLGRLADRHGF